MYKKWSPSARFVGLPSLAAVAGPLSPDDVLLVYCKTPANKLIFPKRGEAVHAVAPMKLWLVPAQGVHAVAPTEELYVPAGQETHLEEYQNVPATHTFDGCPVGCLDGCALGCIDG